VGIKELGFIEDDILGDYNPTKSGNKDTIAFSKLVIADKNT
jgi:hypothetical protein